MTRTAAIRLKIPDNAAYTAMTALVRLGVPVTRVERASIRQVQSAASEQDVRALIESDETLFNPNKHLLTLLQENRPRSGEVWIQELDASDAGRYVGWRLFCGEQPADRTICTRAADVLLCNPAIERAIFE